MGLDRTQQLADDTMLWLYLTMQGAMDNPGAVFITAQVSDTNTVSFTMKVDQADMGKAIGKQGRTARALRTLLGARGGKDGISYQLSLEAER